MKNSSTAQEDLADDKEYIPLKKQKKEKKKKTKEKTDTESK